MAITKKLRFEVFKRDDFKCAYCGKSPPEVTLEIDHIHPKSKGGKDDINNYITACFDCNRGKRDIPLDRIPNKLIDNLEVLKEKEDQIKEYRKFIQKIERRVRKDIEDVAQVYRENYPGYDLSDQFKNTSIRKFLQLLPKHEVIDSLRLAVSRKDNDGEGAIKYFCGVCWRKIKRETSEIKIINEWIALSKKYGKGGGYYNASDVGDISHLWGDQIINLMHETFKEKRVSYWKYFMNLVCGGRWR